MAGYLKCHSSNLNISRGKTHKSAYALFVEFCREKYEANELQSLRLPDTNNRWIIFMKHCMNLWGNMSEEEKLSFQKLANEINSDVVVPAKKEQQKQMKRDQRNCMKCPLSPFYFYCEDYHVEIKKQYPEYSLAEIALKLGSNWCAASIDIKQKYERIAESDYCKFIENY
ncbi:hypothetical protein ILUMI_26811 [Ignelater luminosus]|uniref:HMG box domain-containing protein n=1 Tax=Ignelater luminosus TaxID=2038154 RepID=A0A8K0C5B8_IGNLU|nr:hypothetical protein ILUMI_26811 [Ignelater luminosus]